MSKFFDYQKRSRALGLNRSYATSSWASSKCDDLALLRPKCRSEITWSYLSEWILS